MGSVQRLVGKRTDSKGRTTGESEVTFWRSAGVPGEVLLTLGNRAVYVDTAELRAAVEAVTSEED